MGAPDLPGSGRPLPCSAHKCAPPSQYVETCHAPGLSGLLNLELRDCPCYVIGRVAEGLVVNVTGDEAPQIRELYFFSRLRWGHLKVAPARARPDLDAREGHPQPPAIKLPSHSRCERERLIWPAPKLPPCGVAEYFPRDYRVEEGVRPKKPSAAAVSRWSQRGVIWLLLE